MTGRGARILAAAGVLALPGVWVAGFAATGRAAGDLPDSEVEGRALARKILAQRPARDMTNAGVLQIRNENGRQPDIRVSCATIAEAADWQTRYRALSATGANELTNLTVTHFPDAANRYAFGNGTAEESGTNAADGQRLTMPFAGSDFWAGDLGLEFFHWPQQKVVKKEFRRQCPCMVLESTNPNPLPGGYSKVDCWIDDDSLGIVEAYAYDLKGKRLKNFYPKNLEKVNGQYQVETMVMENLQTGSKSVLEFDLDK